MDFNRNQHFMFGLVLLLVGLQLRYVDTFVLNEKATQFLAQQVQQVASTDTGTAMVAANGGHNKQITPPRWIGYAVFSAGVVLVLHAWLTKKAAP